MNIKPITPHEANVTFLPDLVVNIVNEMLRNLIYRSPLHNGVLLPVDSIKNNIKEKMFDKRTFSNQWIDNIISVYTKAGWEVTVEHANPGFNKKSLLFRAPFNAKT